MLEYKFLSKCPLNLSWSCFHDWNVSLLILRCAGGQSSEVIKILVWNGSAWFKGSVHFTLDCCEAALDFQVDLEYEWNYHVY